MAIAFRRHDSQSMQVWPVIDDWVVENWVSVKEGARESGSLDGRCSRSATASGE